MDVRRRLLDEQRGELEEEDADGVRRAEGTVGVDDAAHEDADDVVRGVLLRRRLPTDQRPAVAALKVAREARDQHVLEDLEEGGGGWVGGDGGRRSGGVGVWERQSGIVAAA